MPYGETKVYYDGSHYIAIPYVPNPRRRRPKPPEETITVLEEYTDTEQEQGLNETDEEVKPLVCVPNCEENIDSDTFSEDDEKPAYEPFNEQKQGRKLTRKELFNELYEQSKDKKRAERKKFITKAMLPYFRSENETKSYVANQFERKLRNLICRRTRLVRKVNLQEFNYFCTFTYDGAKHTEDTFKDKLKGCFKMMCHRKGWKYVGVWERSPEKHRLHFHGLFYIPEAGMVGEFEKKRDYNFHTHKREEINQNIYFLERFGRNDFEPVESKRRLGDAIAYLMKYLEKTGEKIVYSKGLPQYFISDIMDEDIVCTIGQEDKKLLLFDDFNCWDEGCLMGRVSKDVIKQLRKAN